MQPLYQAHSELHTKLERQTFWMKAIADQSDSGVSMKKFCRLRQLKYSTFKGYKYRRQNTESISNSTNNNISKNIENNVAKFVPLQITPDILVNEGSKEESIDNKITEIKIVFNNGHKIILPLTISETNLLLLIKIVGGLQC